MRVKTLTVILVLTVVLILSLSCEKAKEAVVQVTISGTITNNNQPVSGAIVLLLNESKVDSGFPIDNGSISGSDGKYTIIRVEDGTYYIAAIKDENGNKTYDLGVDPIGWYGHPDTLTGVTIPDPVEVSGNDVIGIDIDTMYTE